MKRLPNAKAKSLGGQPFFVSKIMSFLWPMMVYLEMQCPFNNDSLLGQLHLRAIFHPDFLQTSVPLKKERKQREL